MSGDILCGMRGVISWSGDACCRGTLYFFPMISSLATTLENFGREAGCDPQHIPMTLTRSFVHG